MEKPKMPKEKITMTLGAGIKAELMNDFSRYSSGHMMMAATNAEVKVDGKLVGRIRGDISSPSIEVTIYPSGDENKGRSWSISAEQLFGAVMVADEAREADLAHERISKEIAKN